jgi:hypothetical protein
MSPSPSSELAISTDRSEDLFHAGVFFGRFIDIGSIPAAMGVSFLKHAFRRRIGFIVTGKPLVRIFYGPARPRLGDRCLTALTSL